jgi:hypothetical protein
MKSKQAPASARPHMGTDVCAHSGQVCSKQTQETSSTVRLDTPADSPPSLCTKTIRLTRQGRVQGRRSNAHM